MTEHTFSLTQMRAAMKAVVDGGHSVFSPSGSPMWLGCSGSLIPNLFAPDDSGEDAAYGTVAHMVAEQWLKSGVKPSHLIGTKHWVDAGDWGFHILIDQVMLDHVQRYVNWCDFLPGQHYVEQRVDFSSLTPIPGQGGTADHFACWWQHMVITDLKMGKGVHVYATGNSQGMLYALGVFYEWDWLYDFQSIEIRIAQPRRDNFDTWTVTREELLAFAEEVRVKAAAAWVQNAPRTPSAKACQWCRVTATCAAHAKVVIDSAEGYFDDLFEPVTEDAMLDFKESLAERRELNAVDPSTLTTAELDKLYAWRGAVEKFWKKVQIEMSKRAANGANFKSWKLVESRTNRAWRGPATAAKRLIAAGCKASDVVSTVTCSPADAENLLKALKYTPKEVQEILSDIVFKPPGKATLASILDKRPELQDATEDAFSDLAEHEEEL